MRYILLNKPYEVLTQFTDEHGRATLKDFVAVPNIYPVGRLDFDSEGLLLLTDDKALQHRLSDPRFKVPKTYWAQVEGLVSDEALAKLRQGVQIKDGLTAPAAAERLSEPSELWERSTPIRFRASIPTSWLQITISQGMNRQVRKMCAAVGLPCLRLVRAAIADLRVADLAPGQWRELTTEEIQSLRQVADDAEASADTGRLHRPAAPTPPGPKRGYASRAGYGGNTVKPTEDKRGPKRRPGPPNAR
jgi:23S rRNA pseudouridine2457 synthase